MYLRMVSVIQTGTGNPFTLDHIGLLRVSLHNFTSHSLALTTD